MPQITSDDSAARTVTGGEPEDGPSGSLLARAARRVRRTRRVVWLSLLVTAATVLAQWTVMTPPLYFDPYYVWLAARDWPDIPLAQWPFDEVPTRSPGSGWCCPPGSPRRSSATARPRTSPSPGSAAPRSSSGRTWSSAPVRRRGGRRVRGDPARPPVLHDDQPVRPRDHLVDRGDAPGHAGRRAVHDRDGGPRRRQPQNRPGADLDAAGRRGVPRRLVPRPRVPGVPVPRHPRLPGAAADPVAPQRHGRRADARDPPAELRPQPDRLGQPARRARVGGRARRPVPRLRDPRARRPLVPARDARLEPARPRLHRRAGPHDRRLGRHPRPAARAVPGVVLHASRPADAVLRRPRPEQHLAARVAPAVLVLGAARAARPAGSARSS